MATFITGPNSKLWVAEQDITAYTRGGNLEYSVEEQDDTVWGDSTRSAAGGLFVVRLQVDGHHNYAEPDVSLFSDIGTGTAPISVAPENGAETNTAYTFQALQASYTPLSASVGDMSGFTIGNAARSPLVPGTIMEDGTSSRTSSANGSGAQLGAVAAGQSVYAALHVISAAADTLDVTVESDDNGSFTSATTRISFTQVTSTATSEWKSAAGAITDDYWRATWTLGAAGPYDFVVVVGIV